MNVITESAKMEASKQNSYAKAFPWIIVGLAAVFYGYEYFLRITPSVMKGDLMVAYDIGAAAFGNLAAFYYYAYTPMQLGVGVLMDRYGPRRLLTIACLSCAFGSLLFASSGTLAIASLGRFMVGFGSAFAFVGVLKLATIWLPPERFAFVSGLAAALGTVGAISGDILLTKMVGHFGWRHTVEISAGIGVLLSLILFSVIRDSRNTTKAERRVARHSVNFSEVLRDLRMILSNEYIWINGLVGCLLYLPTTVFAELWGIPYLQQVHQFSQQEASWAIPILFLGWGISAPIAGWISDKIKRRCLPMFVGGVLAFILSCILLYVPGLSKNAVYIVLFGFGVSYSVQVVVFAYACEITPQRASGTAIAATNMLVTLGGMLFQPIIGLLLERVWSGQFMNGTPFYANSDYRFALSIIPIGLLLAAVLTLFLKETHCKRDDKYIRQ